LRLDGAGGTLTFAGAAIRAGIFVDGSFSINDLDGGRRAGFHAFCTTVAERSIDYDWHNIILSINCPLSGDHIRRILCFTGRQVQYRN
jgi:hypothetical protein